MKSDKKLMEICMEAYRKMYREAVPSADIDKLIEDGLTKEPDWFMAFFLPHERQVEIVDEICKKHRLSKRDASKVSVELFLGASPRGHKKGDGL